MISQLTLKNNVLQFFYCVTFLLFCNFYGLAQSQPTAQSIPYSQNFSGLTGSTTTYPGGWQGWVVSANPPSAAGRIPRHLGGASHHVVEALLGARSGVWPGSPGHGRG